MPPVPEMRRDVLAASLSACRGAFAAVGLFSGALNVLMLTGSLYMLQVYDRVLPSRSVPTLLGLLILVGVLYSIQGVLDLLRGRMLVRIGRSLDEDVSADAYRAVVLLPLKFRGTIDGLQPLKSPCQKPCLPLGSGGRTT